eukprot:6276137-Alexandrium_andersonii.AAC.1
MSSTGRPSFRLGSGRRAVVAPSMTPGRSGRSILRRATPLQAPSRRRASAPWAPRPPLSMPEADLGDPKICGSACFAVSCAAPRKPPGLSSAASLHPLHSVPSFPSRPRAWEQPFSRPSTLGVAWLRTARICSMPT